jgi:hypothetical protein
MDSFASLLIEEQHVRRIELR